MACLCPISIPDTALRRFGIRDNHLIVPCGHCAGCAKDKRNDWFVRLWSTYNRCAEFCIPVWFVTITIDPKLWPNYNIDNPEIGSLITPWVRSWNERLRYLNGGKMPLRFICSEFGSKGREYVDYNGVQRVTTGALHFHGLLFGFLDVKKLVSGFALTHGHVQFDLIRGPECIRYTVKYCTKDYSISDPSLRARTFCSPGIGDSTFYFGNDLATDMVLINGFHYRTPRYFIEKQFLHVYGRDSLHDLFGHNVLVMQRAVRRYHDIQDWYARVSSERDLDPYYRQYLCFCRENMFSPPASLDRVLQLYDLGQTGISHPLLSYYLKRIYDIDSFDVMSHDDSFLNYNPFINKPFNNYFYERNQTFVPLPLDFET